MPRQMGRSPQEIDEKVAEILRLCLDAHGWQFDPSAISHKTAGLTAKDGRLYSRLNKLLAPGQLSSFVGKYTECVWMPKNSGQEPPGMIITCVTASGSANAGHIQGAGGADGPVGVVGAVGATAPGSAHVRHAQESGGADGPVGADDQGTVLSGWVNRSG